MKHRMMLFLVIAVILFGCENSVNNRTFAYKENLEKTIEMNETIRSIKTNLHLGFGAFKIFDKYLVYNDFQTGVGEDVYLFNKNSFNLINKFGLIGRGPGEITQIGASNFYNNTIWVNDYGKNVKWEFPLDSIVNRNNYLPTNKIKLDNDFFMRNYESLNDSLGIGIAIKSLTFHSMEMKVATLNYNTNDLKEYGYEFPGLKERETYSELSFSNRAKKYVRCYRNIDLITICNMNGTLSKNIVGSEWKKVKDKHEEFYFHIESYKDYFIVSYLGDTYLNIDKNKGITATQPSKLLVFNFNGDYIQTLNVGKGFSSFCMDEDNNRAILYFDDQKEPFAYLDLHI